MAEGTENIPLFVQPRNRRATINPAHFIDRAIYVLTRSGTSRNVGTCAGRNFDFLMIAATLSRLTPTSHIISLCFQSSASGRVSIKASINILRRSLTLWGNTPGSNGVLSDFALCMIMLAFFMAVLSAFNLTFAASTVSSIFRDVNAT